LPASTVQPSKERRRRTVLTLPETEVLTRRVSLPGQVRENLAQVVRFELDRLSPFSVDQVLFDYRALPMTKGAARMDLDLALCRQDRVSAWLKRLGDAGAPVDQIDWEGAWPRANLLPPGQRPRIKESWLEPSRVLTALALMLAIASLASPLWQKSRFLDTLEAEVRRARTAAIEVDDLRTELERARAGSTAVLQQKWEQPRMTELLLELTERIPDDTWVQSLEYRDREVQLRGESSRATALIGLLEGAPGLEGVSFRSPVTQVARTGKERFNLAFTFRPEAAEQ
jgi:general secretion pathway protein L